MAFRPASPPQPHGGNRREIRERFGHERLLDFSASINPLGHPEGLREHVWERWEEILHYPERECEELKASLARFHEIPYDSILPGNGSAELFDLAVRSLGPKRLVLSPPDFGLYAEVWPREMPILSVPRLEAEGFAPDFGRLAAAVGERDLVLFSNPANPSGHAAAAAELASVLRRCDEVGATLAVDEAFADFCPEESLLRDAPAQGGLLIFRSMTKMYGIPGLRLGFLVAHPALLERVARLQLPWSVNALAQLAGPYCLQNPEWSRRTLEVVARERHALAEGLRRIPGLRPLPSCANYLLVELSPPAPGASVVYEALAARGVLVRHCGSFGLGERYVRVAVRRAEENARLLDALAEVLGGAGGLRQAAGP